MSDTTEHGAATVATEHKLDDGQRTVGEGIALPATGSSPDVLTPVAVERSVASATQSKPTVSGPTPIRDEKGRYSPKPPIEFTPKHFWLEVSEVAVAILIAQAIWEGSVWLLK